MKEITKEILFQFCGSRYTKPYTYSNYTYATNGFMCIRVLGFSEAFDPSQELTEGQFLKIFKGYSRAEEIDVKALREHLGSLEKKSVTDCPSCQGFGTVEWEFEEYRKEDDCPKCSGTGKIKVPSLNGEGVYTETTEICGSGSQYDSNLVEKILNIISGDTVEVRKKNDSIIFDISSEVQIILMRLP